MFAFFDRIGSREFRVKFNEQRNQASRASEASLDHSPAPGADNQGTYFFFGGRSWLATELWIICAGWRTFTPHAGNDHIT